MHPDHPRAKWLQDARNGKTKDDSDSPDEAKVRAAWLASFRQSKPQLQKAANELAAKATNELKPLVRLLEKIVKMPNDEHYLAAMRSLRQDLPKQADRCQRTLGNAAGLLSVFEVVNHPVFLDN
jgi:hypothetical protein